MIEIDAPALVEFTEGALAARRVPGGLHPMRLSDTTMDYAHAALRTPFVAEATNGVRLRFATSASIIELDFSLVLSERTAFSLRAGMMTPPTFDLRVEDELRDRVLASNHGDPQTMRFTRIPGALAVVELWLAHNVGVIIHQMRSDAPIALAPDHRPRWVVHGSSITHDALAPGPSDTWPAQLARESGWHLTTLGFRGECHLDAFVARAIASTDADLITLELGINVHNEQSMRQRALVPAVHGFLQSVRDGHPTTPITVISALFGAERENEAHSTTFDGERREGDLTLPHIRHAVHDAVEVRRRHGDTSITYVDGLSLLGSDHAHCFFDGLHPDEEGTRLLRSRLAPLITRR